MKKGMNNVNWVRATRLMGVTKKEFERIREYVYDVEEYVTVNYFEKDDSIEKDYLDLYESLIDSQLILLTYELLAKKMKSAEDIDKRSKKLWDLVCEQAKHYTFQGMHDGYHVYKRDDKIVRPCKVKES